MLTNMCNLKKDIKLFCKKANEAVLRELTDIAKFKTYKLVHEHTLSQEDHKNALESIIKTTKKHQDETSH